ncbi:hypothetical protein M9H77_31638 [Catharanthus roseus]|uniref:Uncharacterized protein n=1 Tax=Catharanthus roseus TaxID=4058 RepID=A0ACC0A4J2_CATRO|nr:hypothetical protein M9H77_31638 [Catharanthus roseus]
MCEIVPRVRIIELYTDCRDKEELIEELLKEFIPSPPKLFLMIEEIEDENTQPVITAPKRRKRKGKYDIEFERQEPARQGNVQQSSRADAARTSIPVKELHREESFDEDYVIDPFIDDDEYCMDDYVVEEEVKVEHEVRNEINT